MRHLIAMLQRDSPASLSKVRCQRMVWHAGYVLWVISESLDKFLTSCRAIMEGLSVAATLELSKLSRDLSMLMMSLVCDVLESLVHVNVADGPWAPFLHELDELYLDKEQIMDRMDGLLEEPLRAGLIPPELLDEAGRHYPVVFKMHDGVAVNTEIHIPDFDRDHSSALVDIVWNGLDRGLQACG